MKLNDLKMLLPIFLILSIQTLFSAPIITNVSPYFGPSAGGTVVSITGSGFTGATAVSFGNVPAVFVLNSDTSITATSPSHSPEVISVTVTTPSGTSPSTPSTYFVYQGAWQLLVGNRLNNSVSIIDTATNTVVTTLPVGNTPTCVQITPDGTQAYVASVTNNTVSVIDRATNTVSATIPLPGALTPEGLAITPDGSKVYVTNTNSGNVSVISTATNTVITTIPVGPPVVGLAITPDSSKVYVSDSGAASTTVISTATNTVITTIPVGISPICAITEDGTKLYVANDVDGTVSVIDIGSDTVIATIPVGVLPEAMAITPDGSKVYVVNNGSNTVSVIDTVSESVITTIPVGLSPRAIAIRLDGTRAYVVNQTSVSVIDTTVDSVIATIPLPGIPQMISLTPDGAFAYVANFNGTVNVINTATNTLLTTITTASGTQSQNMMADPAPLARFTFSASLAGSPSIFDASQSISPVGTIVNYFWDFGDGSMLSTSNPITSHTYAAGGNFNVTLIVTNSAGTSNRQIYFPFATIASSYELQSITNDGGPTAQSLQMITIISPFSPPQPPVNLQGRQVKNKFATQIDLVNVLTWNPPGGGSPPVAYLIFRDAALTELIGIVPSEKLSFNDHNRRKNHLYAYFVVSIDEAGNISSPAGVVID